MTTIDLIYNTYKTNYQLTTDSRAVKPGMLYLALTGERFDGNKFASDALDQGASMVIIDNKDFYDEYDERIVLVEDGLQTLQELAKHHRNKLNLPVIALTGSNGKTTTKELLGVALRTKYSIHITSGNLNNHIGVPLTILGANPSHELMILEMGANHQGEIKELCNIGLPDIGIITNIGKAHLEGFGGVEGVIKGKSELYHFLKNTGGTIVFNTNDELLKGLVNGYVPSHGYHPTETFEVVSSHPVLTFNYERKLYSTHIVGNYNIANIAAALAIGELMLCRTPDMMSAISQFIPSNNRSQTFIKNGIHFILDAYNANPTSMELAIAAYEKAVYKRKVLVLGDMLELGEDSDFEHNNVLSKLMLSDWESVYLVGPCFMKHKSEYEKFNFVNAVGQLKTVIQDFDQDTTVLVKGSRGIKLESLIEFLN